MKLMGKLAKLLKRRVSTKTTRRAATLRAPFSATVGWIDDMQLVWGHRPVCAECGAPFRPGDIVRWLRPAQTGREVVHLECGT